MESNAVMMSNEAIALVDIQTQVVMAGHQQSELRIYGMLKPNQRYQQSQSAYVSGCIEKLNVIAVDDHVTKGSILALFVYIHSTVLYVQSDFNP